ncbi:MAG: hypothetical protein FD169_1166 [Bacillota bacterium]|nr:MAG: hypothetical protein FD169_1166 [Bacillota bacterium]MBS3951258.1 flagellar biosynthetic protein FliO [Peptococcaceae bacterium]
MGEGSFYGSLFRMVLSLVVVFGALFALRYYVLRKVPVNRVHSIMRVRERVGIGPRSQAVVLDVAEKSYLVCLSDNSVSVIELHALPQPNEPQGIEHLSFTEQLKEAVTLLKGRK